MYKLGKLRDAEEIARHVFREYKKEYGPYHQRTYSIAFNLGIVLENQGNFKEAHDVFLYALRYQRDRMSKELENTADCIHHAAFCLEKQHRYLEAQAYYQEVFDVFLATYGPESQATKASSSDIDRVRGLQGPTSTGSAPQSGEPSGSAHRSGVLSYYGPKTTRQTSNEPEKATYYDRDTKTRPKPWYGLAQPPDTGYGR
jgi:tetratricopeptide (TPR) repeat protein